MKTHKHRCSLCGKGYRSQSRTRSICFRCDKELEQEYLGPGDEPTTREKLLAARALLRGVRADVLRLSLAIGGLPIDDVPERMELQIELEMVWMEIDEVARTITRRLRVDRPGRENL
jgi:hypothetical protein